MTYGRNSVVCEIKKTRMVLLLDDKASDTKICHTRREGYMYRVYVFLNPSVSNLPTISWKIQVYAE